jgi:enoyl-CoA hydratase/carnithine racemase
VSDSVDTLTVINQGKKLGGTTLTTQTEPEALYEIKDGIAYITMNRPEKLNAIDPNMRQLLWEAFQDVKANPEVRCAIVTGRGRAFSTGHDLVAMANDQANEGVTTGDLYVEQSKIYKPIISAINGICLAQGCGIALGSDIRIASTEARFGWPQAKRGISSVSGPALLSQVVPRNIAFEFLFTGEFVDAQRALDLMLVNYVVQPEEVLPRAEAMARMITANAPLSLAAIKEVSIKGSEMGMEERVALAQQKRDEVLETEDAKEGVRAFAEKRTPVWQGR